MEISTRKSLMALTLVFAGIVRVGSMHSIGRMPSILEIINELDDSVRVELLKEGKVFRALTLEPSGCGRLTTELTENPDQLSFTVNEPDGTLRKVLDISSMVYEEPIDLAFLEIFKESIAKGIDLTTREIEWGAEVGVRLYALDHLMGHLELKSVKSPT
jgi:hypothetical protein